MVDEAKETLNVNEDKDSSSDDTQHTSKEDYYNEVDYSCSERYVFRGSLGDLNFGYYCGY